MIYAPQKKLKLANHAVAVIVSKMMFFCPNYANNYASAIRQGLLCSGRSDVQSYTQSSPQTLFQCSSLLLSCRANNQMLDRKSVV